MSSTRPYLRKRAVLISYKIFLAYPDALRPAFSRLKEKLEDPDPGLLFIVYPDGFRTSTQYNASRASSSFEMGIITPIEKYLLLYIEKAPATLGLKTYGLTFSSVKNVMLCGQI